MVRIHHKWPDPDPKLCKKKAGSRVVTKMEKPCSLFGIKSVTMHPDLHLFKAINTFKEKYFCYSFQLQYFFSLTLRILKKGIGRVDPDMADLKLREIMTNFHHVSRYIFLFFIIFHIMWFGTTTFQIFISTSLSSCLNTFLSQMYSLLP